MKTSLKFILLATCFYLFACSNTKSATTTLNDAVASKADFTVLHLNDVYEISPLENGKVGGLARVATLRKKLLKEDPNIEIQNVFKVGFILNVNGENVEKNEEKISQSTR